MALSINLKGCRFCFKETRYLLEIDYNTKMNFQELMREELIENPRLPQQFCKSCNSKFQKFLYFKNTITNNQKKLFKALQNDLKEEDKITKIKTEPQAEPESEDDHFDVGMDSRNYFEDYCQMVDTPIKEEYEPEKIEEPSRLRRTAARSNKRISKKVKKTPKRPKKLYNTTIANRYLMRKVGWYSCDLCTFYCKHKRDLVKHMSEHMQKLPKSEFIYECDYCGMFIKYKNNLRRHVEVHVRKDKKPSRDTRFQCKYCEKMVRKQYMRNHVKYVHEKPVEKMCEYCGCPFPDKLRYENHIRAKHTGEKPYKCEICDKAFYNRSLLSKHMCDDHRTKKQICEICNKTFANRTYLRRHIKYIHEERKILCNFENCGMKFSSNYRLQRHQTKHSEFRQFVCKICSSSYKNYKNLVIHVRAAHMKSSFACQVPGCTATCVRKDFMRIHIKVHHKYLSAEEVEDLHQKLRDTPWPSMKNYHNMKGRGDETELFEQSENSTQVN